MSKTIQIAKLYRSGEFWGYGLAVDGQLLAQQESTVIDTGVGKLAYITATFVLRNEQAENQIRIDL